MKATKIKIEKELVKVPSGQTYFREMRDLSPMMMKVGDEPTDVTVTEDEYILRQVVENGKKRNYFVRTNDDELFNDLIAISDGDLLRIKDNSFANGKNRGEKNILKDMERILNERLISRIINKKLIKNIKKWLLIY